MRLVGVLLHSRRIALLLLVCAVLGVAAATLPSAPEPVAPSSRNGLDEDVESVLVERAQQSLPGAQGQTALVVWEREDGGALTAQDLAGVAGASASVADLAAGGRVPAPQPAPDGTVALVPVPLPPSGVAGAEAEEAVVADVDALRQRLTDAAPVGLRARVTGGPAFAADLTKVFAGADTRLLLATAAVVAVLLLITYRSPVLVVVPLLVVGATEQSALALANQVLPRLGLPADGAPAGIASVLVFGAATNYALLLIARYREQLRTTPDIAVASMVGVALAMFASLVVLPAALVLIGRRAFWPFVPRVGADATEGKLWGRLGAAVAARPARVLVASTLALTALAGCVLTARTGLTQNEAFRSPPEAVTAAQRLADALPAGATEPLAIITTPDGAAAAASAATSVAGVASATPGPISDDIAQVDVVLTSEPGTEESRATVVALRTELDGVGDGQALVGGAAAERVDVRATNAADRAVVIPLVLVLVALVLIVLLRSLLAPVLLVATVALSYLASLGASWVLFDRVLDFPALDGAVVVLSFLFLVALGIDYNIFLTTRAREEAREAGTRAGMLTALTVTGGVITSAGLLLAAVFAVLGVLPLILLTQIGIIVGVGVLLDTLLVRTVVVPALAFRLGETFWWPAHPHREGTDARSTESGSIHRTPTRTNAGHDVAAALVENRLR